jgi:hypothetical protein
MYFPPRNGEARPGRAMAGSVAALYQAIDHRAMTGPRPAGGLGDAATSSG